MPLGVTNSSVLSFNCLSFGITKLSYILNCVSVCFGVSPFYEPTFSPHPFKPADNLIYSGQVPNALPSMGVATASIVAPSKGARSISLNSSASSSIDL